MRVFIDGLSARVGGGVTYLEHIVPAFVKVAPQHEFTVLLSLEYQGDLADRLAGRAPVIDARIPARPLVRRQWLLHRELPGMMSRHGSDVFLAVAEAFYTRMPLPFVMLARNNSIYSRGAGLAPLAYRLPRLPLVYLSLHRADRVMFVSGTFRDQVVRKLRLNADKTRVVHHGLDSAFFAEHAPWLDEGYRDYFLYVSSINRHKNHTTLLKAYAQLPADAPHLVLAGRTVNRELFGQLKAQAHGLGISDRVHFLGEVPYHRLPGLYQGAVATVFPSSLETFGHPLVEAMASRVPVVASNLPVCREIAGDAALYFDPGEPSEMARRMREVMDGETVRSQLIARGKARAQTFSWEKCARDTLAVLEDAMADRKDQPR